jgi:hypothetical protein
LQIIKYVNSLNLLVLSIGQQLSAFFSISNQLSGLHIHKSPSTILSALYDANWT